MTKNKRIILWCGLAILISLIINSYDVYVHHLAVSANGSQDILWSTLHLFFILLAILFILTPASLIGLFFKVSRRTCFVILMCCIIYFITAMVCFWIGRKVRMEAFHKLAQNSEPLVQAIKNYESQHASPPSSLDELVPDFLSEIPNTGMGAYPEYEYKVGEEAQKFAQDEWCLVVQTPLGGLNWDIFIYLPSQDYPEYGYGGYLEKVGDWAYVHE